ncbi:hypothetical protein LJ756_07200 [Arthrobacter sp. zg-Y411]|uniref:hypothetical protein n=1 Tax=Arthrobacter zhangbolii TaxID=2886936 RepID=UPI001D1391DD|nr:hypothetical protein [Arthrobacter zhangbolii]MCC3294409.1 hypothetical protein [Arthrobacter zhangbolii]
MEQKILSFVSPRTAWIVLAGCVAFWLASAADLLEAPPGTPPTMTFLWLYANLMLALASTLVAVGAVAVLVLHRRAAAGNQPAVDIPADEDAEPSDSADASSAVQAAVLPAGEHTPSAPFRLASRLRDRAQRR